MLRNKQGQNIIEYVLLITLIIVSVMVVGPYVIRSWNANLKGYEDSVTDSFQEPLRKAPPGNIEDECVCQNDQLPPGCTTPPCCGMSGCGATEDTRVTTCNISGCPKPPPTCVVDDACCSAPNPASVPENCGTQGCDADQVPAYYHCGSEEPDSRFECQSHIQCINQCQNLPTINPSNINPGLGVQCLGDFTGLTENSINASFVIAGNCSAGYGTSPKCQWQCAPTFVSDSCITYPVTTCSCSDSLDSGYIVMDGELIAVANSITKRSRCERWCDSQGAALCSFAYCPPNLPTAPPRRCQQAGVRNYL